MVNELRNLGMGNYETKVLEVLLKENLSLRELSKKAGVPFGKIYSIVKGLKEKGYINENNSRPKLVYIENASELISKLIKKKQEENQRLIEELKQFGSEIDKTRNRKTRFFEIGVTNEDNKNIQLRSFLEAENEVLQILNVHHKPKSNRESKTLWEREIEKAIKRGVIFKTIYPVDCDLSKIIKSINKNNPNSFQIKRVDTDFARCDIIDVKKVLIKLVQQDPLQFGGVLFIENEKLAENLSKIFYELWDN